MRYFGEAKFFKADGKHGGNVGDFEGFRQVEPGSLLEEFRGPASIGAEEEAFFPINDTGVEVRDGHWWAPTDALP